MEKRRRKRFQVEHEAFAAFIRPDEPVLVGRITDISRGGLSVRYLGFGKLGEGLTKIQIFGPKLYPTSRMECRIVYDEALGEESCDVLSVRRCGLKFSRMTQFHSAKLQSLLHAPLSALGG